MGFALETHDGRSEALRKLREKRLDYMVLNGPRTLGGAHIAPVVLDTSGHAVGAGTRRSKRAFAASLVRLIERRIHG